MYFENFPTTKFHGETLADITRKAKLDSIVESSALAYMTYTIAEGERPEDVAYLYYDSVQYSWLVLMANDIIDPYSHWPKSEKELDEYIKVQYAKEANTTGDAVIEWAKNATIGSNILYYQEFEDPAIQLNRASYLNTSPTEKAKFYPVRVYDYEFSQNEARREIVLINKGLLSTIKDQLGTVLHD